eukprot:1156729-Pelagomonas_calceolata.AAC.2
MADVMEGEADWMKLDKEGKQSYLTDCCTPAYILSKLTKGAPKKWESVFKALIQPECGGLCVLECKRCKDNVSPGDPSQAAQRHKCKAEALAAAGVRSSPRKQPREESEVVEVNCVGLHHHSNTEQAASQAAGHPRHQRGGPVPEARVPSAEPLAAVTAGAAAAVMQHPRKALAVVGVSLKGEKAFRTALLNQLHDECREGVFAELKSLLESPNFAGIFICSDGWRCKSESTGRPRLSAHTAQRAGALQS